MRLIATSDVHLGCRYTRTDLFARFLDTMPDGYDLVLHGDVIDHWQARPVTGIHRELLDRLVARSHQQPVTWVLGNHDRTLQLEDTGAIRFAQTFVSDEGVLIAHGHHFDNVMPYNRLFIELVKAIHRVRVLLGAEAMHVARYAKRFPGLYGVLRYHVMMNAVEHVKENGLAAVICGHTHYPEQRVVDGIPYVNTGAWTEEPHYALVDGSTITLHAVRDATGGGAS